jgi:hypothetical protein
MDGVSITYTLGARATARLSTVDTAQDTATAYRNDTDDPVVILNETGTETLFVGNVVQVTDRALVKPRRGVESIVDAVDITRYFDNRIIPPVTFASGTVMRDIVDYIVPFISIYGVTRDAGMATGPALDGFTIDYGSVTSALNGLSAATGYPWRLTPSLVIEMFSPGSMTAGFSFTSSSNVMGEVVWMKSKKQKINKVFVKFGGERQIEKTQSFTATASQTSFTLTYPAAGVNLRGYIMVNGVHTPLGTAPWSWDAGTNSVIHATGATAGTVVTVTYDAQFPIVTSQGNGSYATEPLEVLHAAPDIYDVDEANQLADALLARYEAEPRVITVKTRAGFEMPGSMVTINMPERDIASSSWLIQAVTIATDEDQLFNYTYTCAEGTRAVDSWIDSFRSMLGGGSRSGVVGGNVTGTLLPAATGRVESDLIAYSGSNTTGTRESRLANWTNASLEGPAAILGTLDSSHSWAIVADHLAVSPDIQRLRFVPIPESTGERFVMQLTQANTPVDGEYYLTGNTIGVLNVGATTTAIGTGYRVNVYAVTVDTTDVAASGTVKVGTTVAPAAGSVAVSHAGNYGVVNAAGSAVIGLLGIDGSNRLTLNANSLPIMVANASTAATAGAISTYLYVRISGTDYKIPLHAV